MRLLALFLLGIAFVGTAALFYTLGFTANYCASDRTLFGCFTVMGACLIATALGGAAIAADIAIKRMKRDAALYQQIKPGASPAGSATLLH